MAADRRRWERFAKPTKVLVVPKQGEPFEARVGDISWGGAFVISSGPAMPFLAPVRITFYPDGGERVLELDGQVVHASQTGFGVEFADNAPVAIRDELVEWAKGSSAQTVDAPPIPLPAQPGTDQRTGSPARSAPRTQAARSATRAPRLLLVQDDVEMSALLSRILHQIGADTVVVNNPADVSRALKNSAFDIIICDWVPLDQNPEELVRGMRIVARATPIVVITALANNVSFVTRARRAGVTHVIKKPFKLKDFVVMLNSALERNAGRAAPSV
jgi:CheY-like chemotaxis protein